MVSVTAVAAVAAVAMVVMVVVSSVLVMVVMVVVLVMSVFVVSSVLVMVFVDRRFFRPLHDCRHGSYERCGNDVGEERAVDAEEDGGNHDRLHVGGQIRECLGSREKRHERRRFF